MIIKGINKFTKKFRKPPNYVDNTEILDFLSRVPSKKELFHYRELRIDKSITTTNMQSSSGSLISKDKKRKKLRKKIQIIKSKNLNVKYILDFVCFYFV